MEKVRNRYIKAYNYLCLIGVIVLGLMTIVATNGPNGPNPKPDPNVTMGSITELSSIEVELEWDEAYESAGISDLLFNNAYAALPPEHQPHYKHILTFNHNELTITDIYKSFVGLDSSRMETSEVVRDNTVYNKFKEYLENTAYLCKVTRDISGWGGPAHARITFTKTDDTTEKTYFYGENYSGQEDYELCSEEFSNYLSSLQTNR